jgi:hypothetical protein
MKIALLSLSLLLSFSLYSQNIIYNPGFENTMFPWYSDSTDHANQVFFIDYADKHGGVSSLRMTNINNDDTAVIAQLLPVQGGKVYYMEFWVKAENMQHYMLPFVQFKNDTSWVYDTYFCPNGNTQGWQVVSSRFWVPDSANTIVLFFALFGRGTMWFDDFILEMRHDNTPLVFTVDTAQNLPVLKDYFHTNGLDPGNPAGPQNFTTTFQDIGLNYVRTHDFALSFDHSTIVGYADTSYDPLDPADYYFHFTDSIVQNIYNAGGKVFYRFGQSYSNDTLYSMPPANFDKWAQTCVQIIKHYNDGWANGFSYNMDYFEIWNEPDLPQFWRGSVQEYIALYQKASRAIKQYNPSLKVGGPALSNVFDEAFINEFLDSVVTYNLPLDFFSYHLYYYPNPYYFKKVNDYVRMKLNSYGLTGVELINTEWNSAMFNYNHYVEFGMDDAINAASLASSLAYVQETDLSMFFRYSFRNYWFGMVHENGDIRYSGQAYKIYRQLYDSGHRLMTTGSDSLGVTILASGTDTWPYFILVSNPTSAADAYSVSIDLPGFSHYSVYRLSESYFGQYADGGFAGEMFGNGIQVQNAQPPFLDLIWIDIGEDVSVSSTGHVAAFPSPCTGSFDIDFGKVYRAVSFTVSDCLGRTVFSCNGQNAGRVTVNTEKWTSGVYMVNGSYDGKDFSLKVIRE